MKEMSILPFGESEYNELLRQAVAVINQARTTIAIRANNTTNTVFNANLHFYQRTFMSF
jgi:chromosome condensin MukBEF complex kleisin-like MukF subunit